MLRGGSATQNQVNYSNDTEKNMGFRVIIFRIQSSFRLKYISIVSQLFIFNLCNSTQNLNVLGSVSQPRLDNYKAFLDGPCLQSTWNPIDKKWVRPNYLQWNICVIFLRINLNTLWCRLIGSIKRSLFVFSKPSTSKLVQIIGTTLLNCDLLLAIND